MWFWWKVLFAPCVCVCKKSNNSFKMPPSRQKKRLQYVLFSQTQSNNSFNLPPFRQKKRPQFVQMSGNLVIDFSVTTKSAKKTPFCLKCTLHKVNRMSKTLRHTWCSSSKRTKSFTLLFFLCCTTTTQTSRKDDDGTNFYIPTLQLWKFLSVSNLA